MTPRQLRALFIGFGNVGQKVAEILFLERERFPNLRDLDLSVVGIVTKTHGALVNNNGVDVVKALREIRELGRFSWTNFELVSISGLDAARQLEYDVLVELSTLSINERGEPALLHIHEALQRKRHVVTANKGPLAFAYSDLKSLADENGCRLLYESTVMDGTPLFSLAQSGLRGCTITGLKGILNSTTNFVLSRMEQGERLEDAVKTAQKEGFAEADPGHDLEGWDAAAKIAVLANTMMGATITPFDVDRQGITHLQVEDVQKVSKAGKHLKLICTAKREGAAVRARVALEEIPHGDPFAPVGESGSILSIETDLMAPIIITETDPTLSDTAYGVINDLLSLRDECRVSGIR
ncbi:MAG TPA: homoserine dehydrogenase [Bacteroidetes bacterium]|nr:homoserine dehydrogenase [Bacteroidota bacterium]